MKGNDVFDLAGKTEYEEKLQRRLLNVVKDAELVIEKGVIYDTVAVKIQRFTDDRLPRVFLNEELKFETLSISDYVKFVLDLIQECKEKGLTGLNDLTESEYEMYTLIKVIYEKNASLSECYLQRFEGMYDNMLSMPLDTDGLKKFHKVAVCYRVLEILLPKMRKYWEEI
jgi:hypothetical protein